MNIQPADTSEEGAERKLAAVMFTDIKGFSRKMAENEAGAFDLLKKHDALLRVLSNKFGGKVVKSIGDSFMVDFASAVNAVKCAVESQIKFHNHNKGLSEFEKIEIRIGVHLGDVLIRGEDIFGDGVNIASRIESITEPTRICISSDVYGQVKNKMDLKVFRMGAMKLKNIPEPVEVFEILIPSIPQFSEPSQKALEHSRKQSLEASEKHASRVERPSAQDRPSAHVSLLGMTDEQRQKQAEEMYERAEKYFQMGRIEEAEAELKAIDELVPKYQPSDTRLKQEEEHETKSQAHLTKARELIAEKKLDEAEAETRKVFEFYPLHVGAQQVLLRIEEERYQRDEAARTKRIAEQKQDTRQSEQDREVSEYLKKAQQQFADEQFTEAVYTIRELYKLDPNHQEARELEKSILDTQKEKAEQERIAAEQEERRQEEERIAARQRRREEIQRTEAERVEPPKLKRVIPVRQILTGVAVVAVVVLLYFAVPPMIRALFPVHATIASLSFSGPDGDPLSRALPALLIEDLSRVEYVTTRPTTTSLQLDLKSLGTSGVAASLGATHLLSGAVDSAGGTVELTIRVFDVQNQQAILVRKFSADLAQLAQTRRQVVTSILEAIGIEAETPEVRQPTPNVIAYESWLRAMMLVERDDLDDLRSAVASLDTLLGTPAEFPEATATLAEAYARLYRVGGTSDEFLDYAGELAQQTIRSSPSSPSVLRSAGFVLLAAGKFDQAFTVVNRSMELSPQHPTPYRSLVELFLATGDQEAAARELATVVALDPGNPRTIFLQGLQAHVAGKSVEAARFYESAIAAGGNRAAILSTVLASAWLQGTRPDAVVSYYESLSAFRATDYRLQYYLGRAYAEKLDSATMVFTRGLEMCRNVLEGAPSDQYARAFQALFLTRLGRFQDALNVLSDLERTNPTDPSVLFRIANVYALQNKNAEALRAFAAAIDRRFSWAEVLNPDFANIFADPEFQQRAFRPLKRAS